MVVWRENTKRLCTGELEDTFCTACFDEKYPTAIPKDTRKNRFELKISENRRENGEK